MKKLFAAILLLCMMLCLAACGAKTKTIYIPLTVTVSNGETETVTEYIYDENDILKEIRTGSGDEVVSVMAVECDEYGRTLRYTTEDGSVTEYTYNDRGDVQKLVTTLNGEVTSSAEYTYNEDGKHLQILQDQNGTKSRTEYTYENGIPTRMTVYLDDAVLYTNDYTYDAEGRISLVTRTTADGSVSRQEYTYEEGNVTVIANLDENGEEYNTTVTTIDEHGNIVKFENYIFGVVSYTTAYTYKAIEVPADSPRN